MAIMSLAGLLINRKFTKRPVYLTCCAILCFGTSTLATYFYLNKNEYLKLNYPWTGWLPIISVTLIYTSKALGIGSITHMLQVLSKVQLISKTNFKIFICTKKPIKIFLYFCPSLKKLSQSGQNKR